MFQRFCLVMWLMMSLFSIIRGKDNYDWPMANANRSRNSWISHEQILAPPYQAVDTLPLSDDLAYYDGFLYVSDDNHDNINQFHAIDPNSGQIRWSYPIPNSTGAVAFIPATVDTFVVCGGQKGNGLHVLHNQTGQLLWMKPIGGLYGRHPVIDDHFIYIVGDSLYCLDIRDGETLWSYPAANQTTPVLDDTMLYITQTTKLTCLNKRSGQQQWQVQNKGKYLLIVDENHLYSENDSSIVARDKHDGNIRWSFPISYKQLAATGGNMGAANDQYLFFSIYLNADSLSTLYALDKQTGQEKWHYTFPKYGANAPIIANDIVYIYSGSKEYRIYAFDIHNGNILWKSAVIADGLPIIADHRLYIPSYSGIIIYQHQSTGLDEDHRRLSLPDFKLSAFPNPFNRQAMITYQLLQATQVSLSVYNLSGQIVSQLVNQTQGPGQYRIPWSTAEHSSGTYFFRLITPEGSQTGSLTKLK